MDSLIYILENARDEIKSWVDVTGGMLYTKFKDGNKVLIAGNGGSACQAEHFATELVVKYSEKRIARPVISLCSGPILTACGNDFGFLDIFARQVEAYGRREDALILLSTSGESENIRKAAERGREQGMTVIGLLGRRRGIEDLCDEVFHVQSCDTAVVQEVHLVVLHMLANYLEREGN